MKSTIKEIKYQKTDPKGNSCLMIMADGTEGWYNYKGDYPFSVNEEVEYSAIQKPKKSNPNEFNVVLTVNKLQQTAPNYQQPLQSSSPTPPPRPAIHVGAGKSKEEMKAEASTKVLLRILDAFYDGKMESAQISVVLQEFGRLIWSEIDEIYGSK